MVSEPETSGLPGIESLTSTPTSKPTSHLLAWTGTHSQTQTTFHAHRSLREHVSHQTWLMATCRMPTVWPAADRQAKGTQGSFPAHSIHALPASRRRGPRVPGLEPR